MKKKIGISGKVRWLIVGMVILAIAGSAAFYYANSTQASAPTETTVQTATAIRGNLILYASGVGTIAPANEVSFGFGTSGQIVDLNVKVGDIVEAGQVIGVLNDSEAKAAYEQAKRNLADLTTPAALAAARQAVAEAEVEIYNAKQNLVYLISADVYYWEGKVTEAGEALKEAQAEGGSSPTDEQKKQIDDAAASLNRAQTNLQAAQLKYINEYVPATFTYTVSDTEDIDEDNDTEETYEEVAAPSQAEIAAARAAYELAIESHEEAQAYLDLLNGEALPEDVPGSSLTSLVEAQTALETADENLKATQLISPIGGIVTDLTASLGDYVSESSIITVADLNQPYTIDAYFDAEDWSKIQTGYEADITFEILPDDSFTGTVMLVYPELDSSSNSSLVHATIRLDEVVETTLPIGASAAVDVIGGQAQNVVLVPVEALHETSPGQYTVFVMENDKPRLRVIEVGIQDLIYVEVKSGLEVGEIVTTGITETE